VIKNPWPGKFVVIEGIDYCGKGTQINRLKKYLLAYTNLKLLFTKEPTDGYYGKCIREIIENKKLFDDVSASSLQTLYAVDSREHVIGSIIPMLQEGGLVVCDRYRTSSVAYGATSFEQLAQYYILNETILKESFIWPDLIIFIDITAEEAMKRKIKAERLVDDSLEREEVLVRARENYLFMSESEHFPNFKVISGYGNERSIFKKILFELESLLGTNTKEA